MSVNTSCNRADRSADECNEWRNHEGEPHAAATVPVDNAKHVPRRESPEEDDGICRGGAPSESRGRNPENAEHEISGVQ